MASGDPTGEDWSLDSRGWVLTASDAADGINEAVGETITMNEVTPELISK